MSEMGKEIDRVAMISSASPLHEKLDEAEQAKTDIESLLLERVKTKQLNILSLFSLFFQFS